MSKLEKCNISISYAYSFECFIWKHSEKPLYIHTYNLSSDCILNIMLPCLQLPGILKYINQTKLASLFIQARCIFSPLFHAMPTDEEIKQLLYHDVTSVDKQMEIIFLSPFHRQIQQEMHLSVLKADISRDGHTQTFTTARKLMQCSQEGSLHQLKFKCSKRKLIRHGKFSVL